MSENEKTHHGCCGGKGHGKGHGKENHGCGVTNNHDAK